MTKDEIAYFDKQFQNIEDNHVSALACEKKANTCYKNNIEPMKRYMWLIGIASSFGGSIGTALIIFWIRGKM